MGVPRVRIDDLIAYEQPIKYLVASKSYDDSHPTPVLTAGQSFLLGYTNEVHGKYPASKESPVIIFDDFTTAFKWVDFEFKVKSSAMKLLTVRPGSQITLRYFWYALSTIHIDTSEHARYWISKISNMEIPLPPLAIQYEIIRILDTFKQLEDELQAELDARLSQFQFYRNTLVTFEINADKDLRWLRMADICYRKTGIPITASQMRTMNDPDGDVHVFAGGQTSADVIASKIGGKFIQGPGLIVKSRGIIDFEYWEGRYSHKSELWSYQPKSEEVDLKYLYYFFKSRVNDVRATAKAGSVKMPQIKVGDIDNYIVPIPSIEKQHEIVRFLDSFSSLTQDSQSGLPAEIFARRQQFEYFKTRLLAFKELDVA